MTRPLALAAVLLTLAAAPADPPRDWQTTARADAAAALALIEGSHPGAARELGDAAFLARLRAVRATVAARLPRVRDEGGYHALIAGLAAGFGDGHIASARLAQPATRRWAGIMLAWRAGAWVATSGGDPALDGARLVACDGVAAEDWARPRIDGFSGDARVEAERARFAPRLLIDDANPWAPVPRACSFATAAGVRSVTLAWRDDPAETVAAAARASLRPARAGMGVSRFAGGEWIALETLDPSAEGVAAAVEARAAQLRAAPMVVVDLRGNGGGNSAYAERIAIALLGKARVAGTTARGGRCRGVFWRASADNAAEMKRWAASAERRGDAAWAREFGGSARAIDAAVAAGGTFAPGLPACARGASVTVIPSLPGRLKPPAMRGRLVVVTDAACFSSCLMATDLLVRAGALHVGQATGVSTRYMEVRSITLPSGLRTFSTLMKVAVGGGDYGPYAPARAYPGPMDDEAALKAWVAALPVDGGRRRS